jgi:hypothetical protein
VTAPQQHSPPIYACAAGAVLHAHAGDTLEPAVLLHTFLPPGVELRETAARVDVHADGPGSTTVTVRVLTDGQSLSWQLPIAPFVASLPGQPGDTGRMVLLAVVDAEPEPGFWAEPAVCDRLAAELQLPVADLVDALRGRLTPWLAEDLALLLHDDAHDRAVDHSPAQTLASAVLAHYRGDLTAEPATTSLIRALVLAPDPYTLELAGRLSAALAVAVHGADDATLAAVTERAGPFESEVLRLLTALPAAIAAAPAPARAEVTMQLLLVTEDRDETVRAAVSLIARLTRTQLGPDQPDEEVLRRLGMVDDLGLARLARLWVDLAAASSGSPAGDASAAADLTAQVLAEGSPGVGWLRETMAALVDLSVQVAGRKTDRIAPALRAATALMTEPEPVAATTEAAVRACLVLGRFVRLKPGVGPGHWVRVPAPVAAQAVASAYLDGMERDMVVDLLTELLAEDVEGLDFIDGLVCATAQLLVHLDQHEDLDLRRRQVRELLDAFPSGPHTCRWLLSTVLLEAPEHDPAAADLGPFLQAEPNLDIGRLARKAGRRGVVSGGLTCLEALAEVLGESAQMPREELLGLVLPSALAEHDLLRRPEGPAAR